jgi:dTDP-4-dehydrorhamnose 3,5-epimerase
MQVVAVQVKGTTIPGCYEIIPQKFIDHRGCFVKTFQQDFFAEHGLETHVAEEYYSLSHQGVLRGLHFQLPPAHHTKLVYCISGEVIDAVVDLRVGSPGYEKHQTFRLDAETANMIYIPPGLAHGFYAVSDIAIVVYKVSTVYAPELDSGILWNSVGIEWPDKRPIISQRDNGFQAFPDFISPFRFGQDAEGM